LFQHRGDWLKSENNKIVYNAFTVDFEDWYQGIELPTESWGMYEERLEKSTDVLLNVFKENDVRATFFVLGYNANRYPHLLRKIIEEGHRIGSHGDKHEYVYKMTPDEFRVDLRCSLDSIFNACKVKPESYRAPFFSITRRSFWALECLSEFGIRYDSSIVPVNYYRYGIPDCPLEIHAPLTGSCSDGLKEFPISTIKLFGRRFPLSGGTYFRIMPYRMVRDGIKHLNAQGKPIIFYVHPWEIDPEQPRIALPSRVRLPHYAKLNSTLPKLKKLLRDFKFAPMEEVIEHATN